MQWEESTATQSICTGNSWKRPKISLNSASDTRRVPGRLIYTCECLETLLWDAAIDTPNIASIVGKGNHSRDHVQKLKPRVEQICQELGLQYVTEENTGRMYIDLTGGPAAMPAHLTQSGGGYQQHHGQQHLAQHQYPSMSQNQSSQQYQQGGYSQTSYQQSAYPGAQGQQQPQHGGDNQHNNQNDEIEAAVKKYLPRVIRQIKRSCCVVM